MARRKEKTATQSISKKVKEFGVMDLMSFNPMTLFRFLVYDREETTLFGILRDEMNERRNGESASSWQKRCEDVKQWNRRWAKLMQQVTIEKMEERFGADNEAVQMLRATYNMALAADEAQSLERPQTKLIAGGDHET